MSLRMAALGLLAQHPGSGYDLLKRFEKSMANVWPATQSQLYGELNKLAGAGLIEVSAIGPRGRKEYRITPAGRTELERWITDPADDPPERSAGLLRVFLLGELPRDQALEHLAALAAHSESEVARLKKLEASIPWTDTDEDRYGHAALEFGLRFNAMQAEWAHWLKKTIDNR
ncbi:PadR family transcriptional regulator [Mycolicibacterium peregrinum]|uniref:PadR family transcriptional regulator n=1 Tax=Mycolicibacterium peregrinum TaxID=43304 RepID=UPI0006D861A9|nr:PadR family transcriptional regulator [Mycolicibacterium peregrinum]MCV7202848.1 PadR family transcriptional regulator [Mycolicibacterium peregrinum]ORW63171.1 PadR family transcriptional regulator [Mycolicibacterium peregrinum]OWL96998.1 PadR family transcriptional regulator [Mycolicibacterium peregrinum]